MRDAGVVKIFVKVSILTTTIGLHALNFGIEKKLNIFLKAKEDMFNVGFLNDRKEPSVLGKVIDKTDVVFVSTNRTNCRTPNICINKL